MEKALANGLPAASQGLTRTNGPSTHRRCRLHRPLRSASHLLVATTAGISGEMVRDLMIVCVERRFRAIQWNRRGLRQNLQTRLCPIVDLAGRRDHHRAAAGVVRGLQ
jgi:hypothetical protein